MTKRLQRPSVEGKVYGNHERRIRALEIRGGGGGTSNNGLEAFWWGALPPVSVGAAGGVWTVPFVSGVSKSFTLVRTYFRFENPSTVGTYTVEIQYSSAGSIFTAHAIDDLSLGVGVSEVTHTGSFGTVSSGTLLRVAWTAVGANAQNFTIQLEGNPV